MLKVIYNIINHPNEEIKYTNLPKAKLYSKLCAFPVTIDILISLGFIDIGDRVQIKNLPLSEETRNEFRRVADLIQHHLLQVQEYEESKRSQAINKLELRLKKQKESIKKKQIQLKSNELHEFQNRGNIEPKPLATNINNNNNILDMNNINKFREKLNTLLLRQQHLLSAVGELYRFQWIETNIENRENYNDNNLLYCPQKYKDQYNNVWCAGVTLTPFNETKMISIYLELISCKNEKDLKINPAHVMLHASVNNLDSNCIIRGLRKHVGELIFDHKMRGGWKEFATLEEIYAFGAYNQDRQLVNFVMNIDIDYNHK